jgi:hypothetical protein
LLPALSSGFLTGKGASLEAGWSKGAPTAQVKEALTLKFGQVQYWQHWCQPESGCLLTEYCALGFSCHVTGRNVHLCLFFSCKFAIPVTSYGVRIELGKFCPTWATPNPFAFGLFSERVSYFCPSRPGYVILRQPPGSHGLLKLVTIQ